MSPIIKHFPIHPTANLHELLCIPMLNPDWSASLSLGISSQSIANPLRAYPLHSIELLSYASNPMSFHVLTGKHPLLIRSSRITVFTHPFHDRPCESRANLNKEDGSKAEELMTKFCCRGFVSCYLFIAGLELRTQNTGNRHYVSVLI